MNEHGAAEIGATWEDFCRERERIKLPSGGFARTVWEGCSVEARQSMMRQYRAMSDSHFEEKKAESWGSW